MIKAQFNIEQKYLDFLQRIQEQIKNTGILNFALTFLLNFKRQNTLVTQK